MPNIASQKRQVRTDERRTRRNKNLRTRVKTYISKTERLVAAGKLEEAQKAAASAVTELDKAAVKGVLHRNNAARRKSRLVAKLNQATKKPASA